ncbi:hypothetical protein [Microbacterium murale]|nr:hypothetical protein [Microbacterium murale]
MSESAVGATVTTAIAEWEPVATAKSGPMAGSTAPTRVIGAAKTPLMAP